MIITLRLNLNSIGVSLLGTTNIYHNNQGLVKIMSAPELVLSKKQNAVNYHIVAKEDTNPKLAHLLTKLIPYSKKKALIRLLMLD